MPELPEVETARRALALDLPGRTVTEVRGRPVALRRPLEPERLARALVGRRLAAPRRRGKHLLLDVEGGGSLLLHLGMSGRLMLVSDPGPALAPHTHLVLRLDHDRELRLVDPRRFGLAHWLAPGEETHDPALSHLGIEPLDPSFPAIFPSLGRGRRASVKALLLDQRIVAGVGNIYAAEALWRSGLRPGRAAGAISCGRLERLARALQAVLEEAIAAGGTTIRDFAAPNGELGMFAFSLRVYGRDGEPCPTCQTPVLRTVIAGRSTFWCRRCQR